MAMMKETRKRAETAARLLWFGYGPEKAAKMMGMSYSGFYKITKRPEHPEIEEEIGKELMGKAGLKLKHRADITTMREQLNETMEEAIPKAFSILMHELEEKQDLKTACEVLDRDPKRQFAKGSQPQQQPTQVGVQVNIDSAGPGVGDSRSRPESMSMKSFAVLRSGRGPACRGRRARRRSCRSLETSSPRSSHRKLTRLLARMVVASDSRRSKARPGTISI